VAISPPGFAAPPSVDENDNIMGLLFAFSDVLVFSHLFDPSSIGVLKQCWTHG